MVPHHLFWAFYNFDPLHSEKTRTLSCFLRQISASEDTYPPNHMSNTDLSKILTVAGEGQGNPSNGEAIQLQNMNHGNSASSVSSGFHSYTSHEALKRGLSQKQGQNSQRPPQVPERPAHTLEGSNGEPRVTPPPSYESAMKDIC